MNRIPKYQAWHKQEQKMYRVVAFYLGKREQSVTLRPLVDDSSIFSYHTCSMDEVELREYISMKDRHGIDIYEGDILGLDDPTDSSRAVVVFYKGAFRPELI